MLRDDLPQVVMCASTWMGRTMLLTEAGNQNTSVYPDSNMVVILSVIICDLILLKA
jgi:hypothetical protein